MTDAIQVTSLAQLVEDVLDRVGDLHRVEATSGTTNTLVDPINIPFGSVDYARSQMLFTSVTETANLNDAVLITHTDNKEHKLTFEPVLAATVSAGDTAFLCNLKGAGYSLLDVKAAVNKAIRDSAGIARTLVDYEADATFDADAPTLSIPSTIGEVSRVFYIDSEGLERTVPHASHYGYEGWQANPYNNEIVLNGIWAQSAHGASVWIVGEGRHPTLSLWTSTTTLHPMWLTAQAAYRLTMKGLAVDPNGVRARTVLEHQREAESRLSLIRTQRAPTSQRVRV